MAVPEARERTVQIWVQRTKGPFLEGARTGGDYNSFANQ